MDITLGIVIIAISALGYVSNWLNWRLLNFKITHFFYFLGAFIHESSHALLCLLTGAKILEFQALSGKPHVTYAKPKLAIISNPLISFAPIAGGLLFLWLINKFLLAGYFVIPELLVWQNIFSDTLKLLAQLDITAWQSWVMILLCLNVGAMIGPSARDLKNIWPVLILLLFVKSQFFIHLGLLAVMLILVNIAIQVALFAVWEVFVRPR